MPRPRSGPWASAATAVAPRRLPPSRRSQRQPRSSPFARRRPEFSAATWRKQHGNAAPAIEPSSARVSIHEDGTNGAYPSPGGPGLHVRPTPGGESRIATAFGWTHASWDNAIPGVPGYFGRGRRMCGVGRSALVARGQRGGGGRWRCRTQYCESLRILPTCSDRISVLTVPSRYPTTLLKAGHTGCRT
jgi:hypothetical protein